MVQTRHQRVIGQPLSRLDGPKKVTGTAPYAFEHALKEVAYGFPVQSTIAKGQVASIDTRAAQAIEGVLTILTHENAPRLASQSDADLAVLQADVVAYRGQFIAFVVAETLEIARQAAEAVVVHYAEQPHDVVLSANRDDLYKPDTLNGGHAADTRSGDVEAALAAAPIVLDQTYTTPAYHNNPMEPHAIIAHWHGDHVTLYYSNRWPHTIQMQVAQVFGLKAEQVRVITLFVGGAFGSKVFPHSHTILTVMAA
jgi:xanthine dehydrogenase YagR molybdenum-binding subunit